VTVTGTVDDVRSHYREAKVAVAPFKLGGGTKLKVLEAMAMAVPVVATRAGAQGLEVQDGVHLFIEDDPFSFAQRTMTLLRDEAVRRRVAAQARILVESRYSWQSVYEELNSRIAVHVSAREDQNGSPSR
jgi:glycosyltransferase involved in cell wall biosynthesis